MDEQDSSITYSAKGIALFWQHVWEDARSPHVRNAILDEFGYVPATGEQQHWASEYKIMTVQAEWGGPWLLPFPILQVVEGQPNPAMSVATGWICEATRGWQKPVWWVTRNPGLQHRRPIDVYLTGNAPLVAQAAREQIHLR